MDFSFSKLEQLSQRKWFVYVRQFHHGPFTENEVLERINEGRIDAQSFVWSAELGDWTAISDVEPFQAHVAVAPEFVGEEERAERSLVDFGNPQWPTMKWPANFDVAVDSPGATSASFIEDEPLNGSAFESSDPLSEKAWRPLLTIGAITLAVIASAGIAYRVHQNAFPTLNDVSKDDAAALQSAASESLTKGPRAALAITIGDPLAPKLYVATNEPEGTRLNVRVDGIESSLLDRARASFSYDVVVDGRGVAETPVIRFADGQPIPRGEFRLTAACVSCTDAIYVDKTLFLGGRRDGEYETRLTTYNEKLRAQATGELNELGQLSDTVLGQLKETTSHGRGAWSAFDRQWTQLQTQIEAMVSQWTPSFFDNEVFYGSLYRDLKAVSVAVSELHAKQTAYASGGFKDQELAQQIESDSRDVRRRASELQAKLAQAARLSPTANGRPRSDGL